MDGSLRAQVREGRLVMDEPTDLPEGAVIHLVAIDGYDDLGDEERAELHAVLDEGLAEMGQGAEGIDAASVLTALRAR